MTSVPAVVAEEASRNRSEKIPVIILTFMVCETPKLNPYKYPLKWRFIVWRPSCKSNGFFGR
jgi:hypothetical protein